MIVRHGVQHALNEQVIDVDPDIIVVEGQINRTFKGQPIGLFNQFGRDFKDMPEDELLGCIVA
jgi:hypothetical protein